MSQLTLDVDGVEYDEEDESLPQELPPHACKYVQLFPSHFIFILYFIDIVAYMILQLL